MEIKPIHSMIAMLTNQCNCQCEYCFENKNSQMMTLGTAKKLVDYVAKENNPHITLFGGEPMLMWDEIIVPLTSYAETKGVRLNMTTNGTLLTDDRADFLIDHKISFLLSMDGDRQTQESNRPMKNGGSSFDAIPIDYILSKKPYQPFRATLTPKSVSRLYEDVCFFEDIGVKDLGILPDLFCQWDEKSLQELSEQFQYLENYILQSFRDGKRPLLMRAYCVAFADVFRLQQSRERRSAPDCLKENQCGMGVRGSCSADVFGNFYGCHHVSPLTRDSIWYIGNVDDGLDVKRVEKLNSYLDMQKVGNEHCQTCPLDKICNGGCKSNNYMISGDMNVVPDVYCYWMRSITDSAYRIATILGNEGNDIFIETFNRWKGLRV